MKYLFSIKIFPLEHLDIAGRKADSDPFAIHRYQVGCLHATKVFKISINIKFDCLLNIWTSTLPVLFKNLNK